MEKLNLVEILKDCPMGTPLYSPLFGDITLISITVGSEYPILVKTPNVHANAEGVFTREGLFYGNVEGAECLLFPSRYCRDWSQFKRPPQQVFQKGDRIIFDKIKGIHFFGIFDKYKDSEKAEVYSIGIERKVDFEVDIADLTKVDKFDPKWFKPGDPVLVRDNCYGEWCFSTFSHIPHRKTGYYFVASCKVWLRCVPYNYETKHLVGTTDDAPEFYNLTDK